MVDLLQHGGVIGSFIQRRDALNMPPWATAGEVRAGSRLWYVGEMAHPIQAKDGKRKRTGTIRPSGASRIPTTPPHPVPGGEYDRDGFLYECPVENFRHSRIGTTLVSMLVPHMRRRHGEAALVTADVGFYARREDRTQPPFVADLLVSLTAGDIDAPGTPPEEDRLSYKLWQEPLPDLVLEVVSPSSRVRDTVTKPRRYEALGIPEYWVFDPAGSAVPGGLQGRLLIDGRYADVPPRPPGPGEVPLRTGATAHWSGVLGLYLYADGKELRLHDPETGMLRTLEDTQRDLEDAQRDLENTQRTLEGAQRILEGAQRSLEDEKAARAAAEARAAALESRLESLQRRT